MKMLTTMVLLCLLPLAMVACRNELSRSKAAALINQAYKLPRPEPLTILKSYSKRSWSDPSWMPAVCLAIGPKYSEASETLNALTSKRLVTVAESATKSGECNYVWANVALTDEGNKYLIRSTEAELVVRTSQIALDAVTGIQAGGTGESAMVDFTLKRINPTPFVNYAPSAQSGGRAIFSLFDDGWRIDQR